MHVRLEEEAQGGGIRGHMLRDRGTHVKEKGMRGHRMKGHIGRGSRKRGKRKYREYPIRGMGDT